ncbi:MAG: hypothetical protein ACP5UA_08135 [Candidatus Hydrogenedens sp.]
MKKIFLLMVLVLGLVSLSGCNPDTRLNGVWEGSQWENGKEMENSQITIEFKSGSLKISQNVGAISFNYQGSYATYIEKFPNQIFFTINIDNNIAIIRKGIYRFNLPMFGKTLYLSVTQSDEENYPPKERLNPDVGPVYVLKKK